MGIHHDDYEPSSLFSDCKCEHEDSGDLNHRRQVRRLLEERLERKRLKKELEDELDAEFDWDDLP